MSVSAIVFAAALPVFDFATNSITQRIAGADPAVCLSRFVDYPPSKGVLGFPRCLWSKPFKVNERFWLKDVDFSCVSPWNDECGALRAGTAISRRHVIFARHFPLWKGMRILFVDGTGEVCPCNVEAVKVIPKCDIAVASLNAELTPNIKVAKILPADFEKYIGDGKGLPIVTFNQNEEAFLTYLSSFPKPGFTQYTIYGKEPADERQRLFRKKLVGGDSGNPAFLLIGNEPVLLYCLTLGGIGNGHAIHLFRKEIQAAMDELCSGYKLETFDFEKVRCGDGK